MRVCELMEGPGDARITDLHVWRVGPEAHTAIVEVASGASPDVLRERLKPVHEIAHLTVAVRYVQCQNGFARQLWLSR